MTNMSVSPENFAALSALSRGNWQSFWLQAGAFDFLAPVAKSVYVIPSLVVVCSSIVQVGVVSVDQVDGSERFPLSLRILSEIGTADSERLWKPPRIQIAAFPSDLDLRPFLQTKVAVDILVSEDLDDQIFDGIIIEHGTNVLMVASSIDMPESILITCCKDYVDYFTKGRARRAAPAT